MRQLKTDTLSIRVSSDIKRLLRAAADREHRSIASMIEVLVRAYAEKHGLTVTQDQIEHSQKDKS